MDKMKAARLYGARDLRFEDVSVPEPQPNDVVIKIRANGLCGSDLHFYEDGQLGPYKVTTPYIPGHEASGIVERAAEDGTGPKEGTRVAIEPGIPCRRCRLCKTGRYNLCKDVVFLSEPPINGTFAEYVAVPGDFAHPLPESLSDEDGAFVEPVSVGIQAAKRSRITAGDQVVILGTGPIGLVTMLVAAAYGAGRIIMVDLLDKRLEIARSLGADGTVNAGDEDINEAVMEFTDGLGADVVFDTSGSSVASAVAPDIAARGGHIGLVGWPETSAFPYPVEIVMEKELDVHGVNRYCNTYPIALSLLESGHIDIKPLVTHRFSFPEICDAVEFASVNKSDTIKVMVLQ